MHQFRFIGGRHHHHAWQIRKIGNIKAARMGGTICANQTSAINRKAHRQAL